MIKLTSISNYCINFVDINQLLMKAIYFISVLFFLIGCTGNKGNKSKTLNGKVKIDGSSTVFLITEAVVNDFNLDYPLVKVDLKVSGTGGGFKKFCRGYTDINDASRKINNEELKLCDSAKIKFLELPIAYDGIAIIASKDNNWLNYLTLNELKRIWSAESENRIVNWSQVNKKWPNEMINLFGPGKQSGTRDFLSEEILGKGEKTRTDYSANEDYNVVVEGVANGKYALGYCGLAYYEENKDRLKLVPISKDSSKNGSDAVLPTLESILNKQYQPLSRTLYLYISRQSLKNEAIQEFISFYLENAGQKSKAVGYVPLSEESYNEATKKLTDYISSLK